MNMLQELFSRKLEVGRFFLLSKNACRVGGGVDCHAVGTLTKQCLISSHYTYLNISLTKMQGSKEKEKRKKKQDFV